MPARARRDRRRVPPLLVADHLGAAGGVVGRDRLDPVEGPQEPRALSQRLRMREDPPHFAELDARKREQVVHHRHLDLADDRQLPFDQQVVVAMNRAADRVLDRDDAEVHRAGVDRVEHFVERRIGTRIRIRQQPHDGRLAERSRFSLKRNSHDGLFS